jgi:hypothetical protein
MQADRADDFAVNDGHQNVVAFSAFCQELMDRFQTAIRHLQGVADDHRRGVALPNSFGVRRLSFAYGYIHKLTYNLWVALSV